MPWKDLQKIAIQFTAAFIVAAIFASVAPGAANKVMAFVGDKLGFEEPSIEDFKVTPNLLDTNDPTVSITYSIRGNYGDVQKVVVSRRYAKEFGKTPSGKPSPVPGFTLDTNVFTALSNGEGTPIGLPDKTSLEDSDNDIGKAGTHIFTIEVSLSSGNADSKDVQLLIYDDSYVQMFKGGLSGCVKRGIEIDSDIIFPCDVDKEKRRSLISWGSAVAVRDYLDAFNNAKTTNTECTYKSGGRWSGNTYKLSDACTPEDVEKVWKEYLKISTSKFNVGSYEDNYDCTRWAPGLREVLDDFEPALKVCRVKRQVVMTLNKLGWNDLRETKGWEAGV